LKVLQVKNVFKTFTDHNLATQYTSIVVYPCNLVADRELQLTVTVQHCKSISLLINGPGDEQNSVFEG
jgi:hypothetical protein